MVNLNVVLNDRIARVSRKEIRAQVGSTKRMAAQHRRDVAALKRQVKDLTRRLVLLETISAKAVKQLPVEIPERVRYSPQSVRSQRRRLGLSAGDFGKLIGVTGQAIYNWEAGTSRPRKAQIAKLASVRGIGKREAVKRLEMVGGAKAAGRGRRGGGVTAEEFVLSVLKGGKSAGSAEINAAWVKAGRPGKADNTLSVMTRAGKLKRTKVEGQRGGLYEVA